MTTLRDAQLSGSAIDTSTFDFMVMRRDWYDREFMSLARASGFLYQNSAVTLAGDELDEVQRMLTTDDIDPSSWYDIDSVNRRYHPHAMRLDPPYGARLLEIPQ